MAVRPPEGNISQNKKGLSDAGRPKPQPQVRQLHELTPTSTLFAHRLLTFPTFPLKQHRQINILEVTSPNIIGRQRNNETVWQLLIRDNKGKKKIIVS